MNCIISNLINSNCIKEGNFKLKNGNYSKYYYDMKNLVSHPKLLSQIGDEIYSIIMSRLLFSDMINTDNIKICGIQLGGLPIATYISTKYNIPMIMVRENIKNYGTQKQIEGEFNRDDYCIIIEDVITTGGSVKKILDILKDKINLFEIFTIMKRTNLKNINGININYLMNKNDITRFKLTKYIELKKSRICFSADLENPEEIIKILNIIGGKIIICKIHFDIYKFTEKYTREKFKQDLLNLSNSLKFLLMEDRKFFEISYIAEKQYNYFKDWIDIVTVFGIVTDDVIKKIDCSILLIANMSNNNFDFTDSTIELCKNNNNILGFITQKKIKHNNLFNFTPGISLDEIKIDDQKYTNINNIEQKNKPDIIIIGRTIYNSNNILETVDLINSKFN